VTDQSHQPSRRTLIRTGATAAWTTPVILAATAAPAGAATSVPQGQLTISGSISGTNSATSSVFLVGVSVGCSTAIGAGQLTLTVTGRDGSGNPVQVATYNGIPGWSGPAALAFADELVFVRAAASAAGETVPISDCGPALRFSRPTTFTLVFSAPGVDSVVRTAQAT
jgi:hypothetical protein